MWYSYCKQCLNFTIKKQHVLRYNYMLPTVQKTQANINSIFKGGLSIFIFLQLYQTDDAWLVSSCCTQKKCLINIVLFMGR